MSYVIYNISPFSFINYESFALFPSYRNISMVVFDKTIKSKVSRKLTKVQIGVNVTHRSFYFPRKLPLIALNDLN